MYIVYILASLVVLTSGWSTLDKTDKTDKSYTSHKLNKSPDYNYYKVAGKPFKECKDKHQFLCHKLSESQGYKTICQDDRVADVCKRTCGNCPAVSPLSCHASSQGCCWDNITKVSSGCPECIDRTKACKKVHSMCHLAHMQRACPQTCKICPVSAVCFDDDHQKEYCPLWKKEGFCNEEKELMTQYCASTCGLCDLKEPVKETSSSSNGNEVVQVFRKGSLSLMDLPADEKLESEKQLIKILLQEKKKRGTTTTKNVNDKKKDIEADNEVVATVINDNKDKKENNMVEKAAVASNDKKGIDESFEALVKLMKTKQKKTVESSGNVLSDKSFEALVELLKNEKKSVGDKLDSNNKDDAKKREEANKVIFELINKNEIQNKVGEKREFDQQLNDAMLEMIKNDATVEGTKKSLDREILNIINNNNNKDDSKAVAKKESTKASRDSDEVAKEHLLQLVLNEETDKKREVEESKKNTIDEALFDLLKERKDAEDKKEKKGTNNKEKELLNLLLS